MEVLVLMILAVAIAAASNSTEMVVSVATKAINSTDFQNECGKEQTIQAEIFRRTLVGRVPVPMWQEKIFFLLVVVMPIILVSTYLYFVYREKNLKKLGFLSSYSKTVYENRMRMKIFRYTCQSGSYPDADQLNRLMDVERSEEVQIVKIWLETGESQSNGSEISYADFFASRLFHERIMRFLGFRDKSLYAITGACVNSQVQEVMENISKIFEVLPAHNEITELMKRNGIAYVLKQEKREVFRTLDTEVLDMRKEDKSQERANEEVAFEENMREKYLPRKYSQKDAPLERKTMPRRILKRSDSVRYSPQESSPDDRVESVVKENAARETPVSRTLLARPQVKFGAMGIPPH